MEGAWRGAVPAAVLAACAVAVGCGSDGGDAVATDRPEATFAPFVRIHPGERWFPISADELLEHASLWWAEDEACEEPRIALSRATARTRGMPERGLDVAALGSGDAYAQPRADEDCEPIEDERIVPSQLSHPTAKGERVEGMAEGEGFFLALDRRDWHGEPPDDHGVIERSVPAYYDLRPARVDGDAGVRIAYWFLYGRNEDNYVEWWKPIDGRRPWSVDHRVHEADWEGLEVFLRHAGDDAYEPKSVRFLARYGHEDVPWSEIATAGGTHPVAYASLGGHTPYPTPGFHKAPYKNPTGNYIVTADTGTCLGCPRWRTWHRLESLREQAWYGYGGAWGDTADLDVSDGPPGPTPPRSDRPTP